MAAKRVLDQVAGLLGMKESWSFARMAVLKGIKGIAMQFGFFLWFFLGIPVSYQNSPTEITLSLPFLLSKIMSACFFYY